MISKLVLLIYNFIDWFCGPGSYMFHFYFKWQILKKGLASQNRTLYHMHSHVKNAQLAAAVEM